jgi:hypothetical protein
MPNLAQISAPQSTASDKEAYEQAKPHDRRYIYRIGPDGGTGWNVNIRRGRKTFRKRFSDSKHGSEDGALTAAKAWRDEMERLHPRLDRKARLARPSKANSSGVKGVFQQFTPRLLADGSTRVSTFWTAKTPTWVKPERTRSFSIDKYGEREAFRMAVEARQAFETQAPD